MAVSRIAITLLPLALAACATSGTASRHTPSAGPKLVIPPAQAVHPSPPLHRPKASPYAPAQEDLSKRGDYVAGGLFRPGVADTVPDHIPDVDAIPEPEVRAEPRARSGNRDYAVLGKRYQVLDSAADYLEQGGASYYGNKFHGRRTSSGEVYDMYAFTAAHKTLPLPSYARVTNLDNGKSVVVKINDRGPFHRGRIIDLSYAAAVKLGYRDQGTARVEVRALHPDDSDGMLATAAKPADASAMDRLLERLPDAEDGAQPAAGPVAGTGYRFDMHRDGKVMTADEFDAWMTSRRVRVATGKPGTPDREVAPVLAAAAIAPDRDAAASVDGAHQRAAPAVVAAVPGGDQVTLQVASFSNQQNARQALALLQDAAIASAQLLDADVNGKKIWRLRIGPIAAAGAPELAARIVGLGFGQPQHIRD